MDCSQYLCHDLDMNSVWECIAYMQTKTKVFHRNIKKIRRKFNKADKFINAGNGGVEEKKMPIILIEISKILASFS